jgi:protein-disulfide isomerase
MGKQMRLVFRRFPLSTVHPHAEVAAEAAEAAGGQRKFWQMHDVLFENQQALEIDDLARYAAELGLDLPRFLADLEERVYLPRLREDFASGLMSGVSGTPTFFIDGVRHEGSFDLDTLVGAIEAALDGGDGRG